MDQVVSSVLWYKRTRLHLTLAYASSMWIEQCWRVHQPGKPAHESSVG